MTKARMFKIISAVIISIIVIAFLLTLRCWECSQPKVDKGNSDKIEVINGNIKDNNNKMEQIDEKIDNSPTNDINDMLNKRNGNKR